MGMKERGSEMKKQFMTRILCIVTAIVLGAAITACSSNPDTSAGLSAISDNTESVDETTKATAASVTNQTSLSTTAEETSVITSEVTENSSLSDELPADFPSIDSSTARIPITRALYDLFVGEYNLSGPVPICSKTHGAWLNLADGNVDMIFAVAPTVEEKDYLAQKDVDVEMRLYGCDGLVFLGNSQNPVKSLTQQQIKDIYRGEITNWSELGGPDEEINAYYREDQSGSQRFFEDLVWKGEEIPDFSSLGLFLEDDMSSITDMVIFDPYAIGFNIMSYINLEYSDPALMLFTVDGIAPSTETLSDASYPYITQAYIIIRADEPSDSSARWLFNWFGCDKSREILTANSSLSLIFSDPILVEAANEDS